jgi:hypothetical protein
MNAAAAGPNNIQRPAEKDLVRARILSISGASVFRAKVRGLLRLHAIGRADRIAQPLDRFAVDGASRLGPANPLRLAVPPNRDWGVPLRMCDNRIDRRARTRIMVP